MVAAHRFTAYALLVTILLQSIVNHDAGVNGAIEFAAWLCYNPARGAARMDAGAPAGMATVTRTTALLLVMPPTGTWVRPAWDAFIPALQHRGQAVVVFTGNAFPRCAAGDVERVRTAEELARHPYLAVPACRLADLRAHGAALHARLEQMRCTELYVWGDAAAMQFAARCALWCREHALPYRVIGVPACPFNSVPFTDHSLGFASALRWCAGMARSLLAATVRGRRQTPLGVLEIQGDRWGWLSAGAAALAGDGARVLCLPPQGAWEFKAVEADPMERVKGA